VTLICVGDISLQIKNKGSPPFTLIKDIFAASDIIFGNLETVVSIRGRQKEKSVVFRASPDKIRYLKQAGFNILNLANNHIMDYGQEGLNDSVKNLKAHNIHIVGIKLDKYYNPVIKNIHGIKLGFLGYTDVGITRNPIGPIGFKENRVYHDVSLLKKSADVIIVSLHWGEEFVSFPSPKQQKIARKIIDNGADIIVGHHPHVIQGMEKYKHGFILYSLGNFNVVDREINEFARGGNGLVVKFLITKQGIDKYYFIPIKLNDHLKPILIPQKEEQKFSHFIKKISLPLQGKRISPVFWYSEASQIYLSLQVKAFLFRIKTYGIWHLIHFLKWCALPYTAKMYLGLLWNKLKKI